MIDFRSQVRGNKISTRNQKQFKKFIIKYNKSKTNKPIIYTNLFKNFQVKTNPKVVGMTYVLAKAHLLAKENVESSNLFIRF